MLGKWKLRTYLIKAIKITGWTALSLVALLLIVALAIQVPFVQNKLTQKAVTFLEGKIGTKVSLQHISLSFPKRIVLNGLYLEDQDQDTLFSAGELSINTNLWGLAHNEITLDDIELDNLRAYVERTSYDSTYNFQYIVDAFAGDSTSSDTTSQSPWKFSVGAIELTRTLVGYKDSLSGDFIDLRIGKLELDMDEFDLDKSRFKIGDFNLENVKATVSQKPQEDTVRIDSPDEGYPAPIDLYFDFDEITLHKIEADYRNITTGQVFYLRLGDLLLASEDIDLSKYEISLEEISLNNTFLSVQQTLSASTQGMSRQNGIDTTQSQPTPWKVKVNKIDLSNNNIQLYDFNAPISERGIDYNHLWITRLNAYAEDVNYRDGQISGKINNFSLLDKSGFSISSFKSIFELTDTSAQVRGFVFKTPDSKIQLHADARFESFSTLNKDYPELAVKLDIHQSSLSLKDILFFSPHLLDSIPVTISKNEKLKMDVLVSGLVKDLTIDHLDLDILSKTSLKSSGKITGLPGDQASFDISVNKFHTSQEDIKSVLADTLLPGNISLPEWIDLSGRFTGTAKTPTVIADVNTDLGTIKVNATMNLVGPSAKNSYSGAVELKRFQLGKVLGQEQTIGALQMTASVKGTGLTLEDLNARIDLVVSDFQYQGYTYHDFKVNGTLKRYFFSGKASLEDKNLNFNLEGDLDYNGDIPEYTFQFELKNADFKALNISQRPLRARGTIDVHLSTADFKVINGDVDIRKVAIYNGEELYAVDSLLFASIDQKGESKISIRSDILSGDFEGTINLFSMPDALRRHFNNYFSTRDTVYAKLEGPQNFDFKLVLKNTDLLTKIIFPELRQFVPGRIEGGFNSEENKLELHFDIAKVLYGGIGLDSVNLHVTSDENSLEYAFGLHKVKFDTLRVEAIQLRGKVANDSIRTKFVILDSLEKNKYVLGGAFYSLEKVFQFHLLSEQIIINYAPWESPADNSLKFTSKGITASNFSITNINESITLLTQHEEDSATSVVFKDLNLQNLANLVEGTILADGLMNGDFNLAGEGAFNSNLKIQDFKVFNQAWGDVLIQAGRTATGPYNFDLEIDGDNAALRAGGYYVTDSASSEINITAELAKLNLQLVEPFIGGQLKNTEGYLTGNLNITGNPSVPQIRGTLSFRDAALTPSFVNSKFFLKNETITFAEEGIVLKDFKILDEKNNAATLKGNIKTSHYSDFDLNLSLAAKNFQVINTTEGENDLFYGKVEINTNTKISGNFKQPKIQMEISLNEESELTYIVPQSEKGILEQKGIVEFVDRDAKKDPFLASLNMRDSTKSSFTGMDLTANIELHDKETLSIVIDPVTGDKLSVKGNSTLTLDIDPTGDMRLTGRYEITEGSYDLTFYKLVKRNFAIEKGSTIIWAGDPLDATMDIRASFTVETSPMELVSNQLTASSTQELNMYKQRLPFLVFLKIKGNLLTPEISFELDMPIEKRNAFDGSVYAKIKDINTRESDLNKQVFALLILRRFISDNPFDSQSGGDVESTARRSVSKLLSEQLNRLSENIKGIELSFDVKSYEDYSTGEAQGQTEVQLGVSKSLLDDKLIVKVSGNVDIEGNASSQSSFADYIGDIALEYKLTEDGRFRITGFRNSNYDIISGELIETGAGLIYIKDYNTLRELFKANAKDK